MSGNPSIRHTTLAAFLFHPWSHTARHSPLCSTSTRPSCRCFPPLRRIPVKPLATPVSSRTPKRHRNNNAMLNSRRLFYDKMLYLRLRNRKGWCSLKGTLVSLFDRELWSQHGRLGPLQCCTAKEKPAEWRFPFAGASRDRWSCRKNEIG